MSKSNGSEYDGVKQAYREVLSEEVSSLLDDTSTYEAMETRTLEKLGIDGPADYDTNYFLSSLQHVAGKVLSQVAEGVGLPDKEIGRNFPFFTEISDPERCKALRNAYRDVLSDEISSWLEDNSTYTEIECRTLEKAGVEGLGDYMTSAVVTSIHNDAVKILTEEAKSIGGPPRQVDRGSPSQSQGVSR